MDSFPENLIPEEPRPRAFLEISSGSEENSAVLGRLVFELAADIVPRTTENFVRLLQHDTDGEVGYRGSPISPVMPGAFLAGGDIDGLGGRAASITGDEEWPYIEEENFAISHAETGVLTMIPAGVDRVGSMFLLTLKPLPHLNGSHVGFGKMIEGMEVADAASKVFNVKGKPVEPIFVSDCGLI